MMFITRGDGYVTTVQAAGIVRVKPATIRKWKQRGHLAPVGLDERGNPLYRPGDVIAAEKSVHDNGIATSGVDPRRTRKSAAAVLYDPVEVQKAEWHTRVRGKRDIPRDLPRAA